MMPAANQGVGMNTGFPDVCTTPAAPVPIPIPYPNIAMNAMSVPFIPNIMVSMAPAHNMGAKPMLTNGDNAGVAHPLFMQPGGTTMGNPRIMMGGMPAAHLAVPTYGNNFNNPVGAKLVPSVTNVLLGYRASTESGIHDHRARLLHSQTGTVRRLAHGIVIVRIPCMSLRVDRWLARELQRFAGASLRGLVLDLRSNPGGSVTCAQRMTQQIVQANLPVAVVIDEQTASAAELVAASLRGHSNVRSFGTTSYGKTNAASFLCTPDRILPVAGQETTMRCANNQQLNSRGVCPDEATHPHMAIAAAHHWLRNRSHA
jgi:carboxyl-terminal processing protease